MHRLAHRGVRSSQATPAAVDKSAERLEHKNSDSPRACVARALYAASFCLPSLSKASVSSS
jgi:hypothetical protein